MLSIISSVPHLVQLTKFKWLTVILWTCISLSWILHSIEADYRIIEPSTLILEKTSLKSEFNPANKYLRWKSLKTSPLGNHKNPIVVAHRGASCCRPEHSLAAYELAIQLGAHYIEQDVVSSADGELLVLHDRDLGAVSNIAENGFHSTKKPKLDRLQEDGIEFEEEFFVEDYSMKDISNLRAKQRFPFRDSKFNSQFQIVTLKDVFQFANVSKSNDPNPTFGLYIELKRPTYFRSIGLPLEEKFLKLMEEFSYILPNEAGSIKKYRVNTDKPIIIQCFEGTTLKYFRDLIDGIPSIHLIKENLETIQPDTGKKYKELLTDEGLQYVATYADGIGPSKDSVLTFIGNGKFNSTGLVARAHKQGLVVHPYTFRSDSPYYFKSEWGLKSPEDELLSFFEEGIDGFFTDFPGDGLAAYLTFMSKGKIKNNYQSTYLLSFGSIIFFTLALYTKFTHEQKLKHD